MPRFSFRSLILVASLLLVSTLSASPVALELVLLVDISGSVDATEYNLQKTGYVNAFNNAAIQALIAGLPNGLAVTYVEWSGAAQQYVKVGWTLVTNAAQASAFATAISTATQGAPRDLTAPGSAINFGQLLFAGNGFEGTRRVIDVSGDGDENNGDDTFAAATNAHATGTVINGLAILDPAEPQVGPFYQSAIVTPGGGTLFSANGFADFENAIKTKLSFEVRGGGGDVPEPATFTMIGVGLLGLVWKQTRRG